MAGICSSKPRPAAEQQSKLAGNRSFVETVLGFLRDQARRTPDAPSIYSRSPAGEWNAICWADLWSRILHLAAWLQKKGLVQGDRLGIIAPNCLEWEVTHLGGLAGGAVVIGIDGHDTAERIQKILENAAVNALIVKDSSVLAKIGEMSHRLKLIVLLSGDTDQTFPNTIAWHEIWKDATDQADDGFIFPHGDHPATLIYTSGTTGEPKGILYNHRQLLLACEAIVRVLPAPLPGARFVCWLPLANLFQRIMNQCALMTGSSLYMVADPLKVLDYVKEIQPDVFIGVPRFFEKVANGIKGKLDGEKGLKRTIAQFALQVGARQAIAVKAGIWPSPTLKLQHRLADRIVLRHVRGLFGDRLQYLISGSAPLAPWVLEFFQSLGLLVLEAYGLSENILPMAMNTPSSYRFGTVGKVLPENEIRLDSDGEVLVKGPGLFNGYHGDPESFSRVSEGGFYRTGDYGSFDDAGFLRLTGRKSEIIKTSAGRRIALLPIESTLREIPWVDHALVLGSGRKCLAALLTVDRNALPGSAVGLSTYEPQLRQELLASINRLGRNEQPAAAILLLRSFTIDGGELTPNLKLRRMEIERKYQSAIESLYAQLDAMSGESATERFLIQMHE
jgi:long-chain acyl-CoA synthetase